MSDEETPRPLLRVVRGEPDDVELAALTSVIAAAASRGGGDANGTSKRRSLWGEPAAQLRTPIQPGPGAWRASSLPR
ncbi:acyl-CoA carboxylase subunit epsilon [Haloechinothrix halophila]|uniref:acyl-CoA carboxylase subunit epsilon n=1 Tax=Haloechinothrix halophila TaxID=1069073 RepID=UPI000411BEF9|nr:acyl-CoA carboxylase subunit epsilon [Haloechinothrix halophila]